ncbi:MAG: ribosome biogenesis GTPase Der [Metamycoplasmataceae bacterium]
MKKIVLVGKPNVGKSTLFNRIIGKREMIVYDQRGVTRDRIYRKSSWLNKDFIIIDTGGITYENKPFLEDIRLQAQVAIEEADVVIFMLDGRSEVDNEDIYVLNLLRKAGKKVILAANKLEDNNYLDSSLYSLGFDKIYEISALHNIGIGELLEDILEDFPVKNEKEENKNFKISIIGKPNAGKSSLLNKILNENRSIISNIPGTTRDSVNSIFKYHNQEFEIIDTAGINRKSKLNEAIDHYALLRAFNSLDESNLTILVIDSTLELSHFDARIAGYAMEYKKPIIIAINKWDLIEKDEKTIDKYSEKVRKEFKFLSWAPIIYISALTGTRVNKLLDVVCETKENIERKINTSLLNEVMLEMQLLTPAPSLKGRRLLIKYIKQIPETKIPTFLLVVNDTKYLHFSYQRHIEKKLRESFNLKGVPLELRFKNKNNKQ